MQKYYYGANVVQIKNGGQISPFYRCFLNLAWFDSGRRHYLLGGSISCNTGIESFCVYKQRRKFHEASRSAYTHIYMEL